MVTFQGDTKKSEQLLQEVAYLTSKLKNTEQRFYNQEKKINQDNLRTGEFYNFSKYLEYRDEREEALFWNECAEKSHNIFLKHYEEYIYLGDKLKRMYKTLETKKAELHRQELEHIRKKEKKRTFEGDEKDKHEFKKQKVDEVICID